MPNPKLTAKSFDLEGFGYNIFNPVHTGGNRKMHLENCQNSLTELYAIDHKINYHNVYTYNDLFKRYVTCIVHAINCKVYEQTVLIENMYTATSGKAMRALG